MWRTLKMRIFPLSYLKFRIQHSNSSFFWVCFDIIENGKNNVLWWNFSSFCLIFSVFSIVKISLNWIFFLILFIVVVVILRLREITNSHLCSISQLDSQPTTIQTIEEVFFQTKGLNFKSAKWKLKIDDAIFKNGIIFKLKLKKQSQKKNYKTLYLAEFLISTKCFYVSLSNSI